MSTTTMADRKTFEMFLALTLIVKKRNATVEGRRRRELQIKLRRGSTTVKTRPFWFASNNLWQNVLSRQRFKKQGLTNTSSPTRTFGFSAKATPLIARPNLTRRSGNRRTRGRILGGIVALIHSISKVGGRIGEDRGE